MDSMPPPMFGTGLDVDLEFGLPQMHEELAGAAEQRREGQRLSKIEAEATLLSELNGQGGEIVKRIVNQTMQDLNTVLLSNLPDENLLLIIKQVRWNLQMLQDSLGLTSLFENSTKHVILSFVTDILRVSLPQHQGYQTPFNQPKAASDNGTPAA